MIIAECGQNHMGDMELAEDLIDAARDNGADLVKFQLYDSVKLYGEKQKQELTMEQAGKLMNYGNEIGIEVFFSVFDTERVKWCEQLGVHRYKVAYSCRRDNVLLDAIAKTGQPCIISTSVHMNHYDLCGDIKQTKWLYCIPKYPTIFADIGLKNVSFDHINGFSDHTVGIEASMVALSRGAQIIEKHFRLECNPSSPDYLHSITPSELKRLALFEKAVKEIL